jgi:hypothetical protein
MTRSDLFYLFTLLEEAGRELLLESPDYNKVALLCRQVARESERLETRRVLQRRALKS